MGKAARLSRRHALGRPLRTYRQVFPMWWTLLWAGIVLVIVGAVAVNGILDPVTKIVSTALTLVVVGLVWALISDNRMVVCEGGVLIGKFFPFTAPKPIPYALIEPRGITCVEDVGRFPSVTGRPFGSTLYVFPQSRRGVLFDGPAAAQVRRRPSIGSALDAPPDTVRGGTLWAFAYRGRPEELVELLRRGFVANGVPHAEAVPALALPERSLGRDLTQARTRVNGLAR